MAKLMIQKLTSRFRSMLGIKVINLENPFTKVEPEVLSETLLGLLPTSKTEAKASELDGDKEGA